MKTNKRKSILMLAMMVLLLTVTVGGTIAYLAASTDELVNTFTPGTVTNKVEEEFDGETKTNVKVTNTGTVKSYIRAAIIVTWKATDGSIYGTAPVEGTDYKMTLTTDQGWSSIQDDGYYYYRGAVEAGEFTNVLISECILLKEAPDGYQLSVEIISSSVQAEPETAVTELWGATAASLVK